MKTKKFSLIMRKTVSPSLRTRLFVESDYGCAYPECKAKAEELEIHHIDSNPFNNSLANLIVLCANHHRVATQGQITRSELEYYKSTLSYRKAIRYQNLGERALIRGLFPTWKAVVKMRKTILRFIQQENQYDLSPCKLRRAVNNLRAHWPDHVGSIMKKAYVEGEFFYVWGELIAFPDVSGNYSSCIRKPRLEKGKFPIMIRNCWVEKEGDDNYITGGDRMVLESLPLVSGYIQDLHEGFPTRVRNRASRRFHGAYYWVKPVGIRAVVRFMWFWEPAEAQYSVCLWYPPDYSSPNIGALVGKRLDSCPCCHFPWDTERNKCSVGCEFVGRLCVLHNKVGKVLFYDRR